VRDLGRIVAKAGNMAKVSVRPEGGECESCALKSSCAPEGNIHYLWALNEKGGEVGEEVTVELRPKVKIFGTALVFIFPLAGMFLGFFAGYSGGGSQDYGVVGAALGLVLFMMILKIIDKEMRRRQNILPKITHIFK